MLFKMFNNMSPVTHFKEDTRAYVHNASPKMKFSFLWARRQGEIQILEMAEVWQALQNFQRRYPR